MILKVTFIVGLIGFAGCANVPQNQYAYSRCSSEDAVLINHWVDELEAGEITVDDFKFLVRGRVS